MGRWVTLSPPKDPINYALWVKRMRDSHVGKSFSSATRSKMSAARKGVKKSVETRMRISNSKRGIPRPAYVCEKIRAAQMGNKNMLGKTLSSETKLKIGIKSKGRVVSEQVKLNASVRNSGSGHPQWKGGISFLPYCQKFNAEFKERVRVFFNHTCVECGQPQTTYQLHIHHVNFNKQSCCDNTAPIFVSLCHSCHSRTNYNRIFWEYWFTEMIMRHYNGQCYLPKVKP